MKGKVGKVTAALGVTFCLILSAWLLAVHAPWTYSLWVLFFLATGILIGSYLSKRWPKLPYVICVLVTVIIVGYAIVRKLPIHSLDWAGCYRIDIYQETADEAKVTIDDPNEVRELVSFADRGHYEEILKAGTECRITVFHEDATEEYFIFQDAIGSMPGGFSQSVFIPRRPGLYQYIGELLEKHGRAR